MVRGAGAFLFSRIRDADGELVPATSILLPNSAFARRATLDRGVYYLVVDGYPSSGGLRNEEVYSVTSVRLWNRGACAPMPLTSLWRPVGGTINPMDDADYFRIELSESNHLRLHAVGIGLHITAEVLDSNGNAVDATCSRGASGRTS